MALDPVPAWIGGGAEHAPEVARLLNYVASNGTQGIITPGDFKVTALTVPGASVNVAPGAAIALNKASGGAAQSYISRNTATDTVGISANAGGTTRYDMVVLRIEDPFASGEPWLDPTDPTVGPYNFLRVISNVASTATELPTGQTGIPLARIAVPASTSTITNGMITDLRYLAQQKQETQVYFNSATTNQDVGPEAVFGAYWPWFHPTVKIPSWATHAVIVATMSGILVLDSNYDGYLRLKLGAIPGSTLAVDINTPSLSPGDFTRTNLQVLFSENVSSIAGTSAEIGIQVQGSVGGLRITSGTQLLYQIQFINKTI